MNRLLSFRQSSVTITNIPMNYTFKMSSQGGKWEEGSGWGTHVKLWLTHVSVWQKPLQYCKVISLQLIKINGKIKNKMSFHYC